jgi:surface antigen
MSLPALCLALTAVLTTLFVSAPAAEASSTIICSSFTRCDAKNLSNYGYEKVYRQMWWRMYGGHNCTNYVAYRMVSRGMSATRPWSGSGDARNWGVVFSSKTNQTPMVGSVAWWSYNHVAYVEQVIDANTIVISEDHYGGDFDWRRIVRTGGGWPTGFIHLNDEKVTATAAPVISGTAKVGVPLTATTGTWNKAPATKIQWLANGAAITGATATTYTPTAAVLGKTLSVKVTATRSGYLAGTSTSRPSAATAPGTFATTSAPSITGIAKVGATLTAKPGTFTPAPDSTATTWYADGVLIAGATGNTLTLRAAQLNKTITAVSTATKAGYTSAKIASAPTAKVGPEKITVGREPTLSGPLYVGRDLVVHAAALNPGDVTTTYTWLRDGTVVPGRVGPRYSLEPADVGHKIAVRISYTKPGYTTVDRTLSTTRIIRAFPRVTVVSRGERQITVLVNALGVSTVQGKVVVRTPSGASRTVTLNHGEATFTAPWIHSGLRWFRLEYLGSYLVQPGSASRQITVR